MTDWFQPDPIPPHPWERVSREESRMSLKTLIILAVIGLAVWRVYLLLIQLFESYPRPTL